MKSPFNGAELRLARVFNGLTLEEVACHVSKTRQYIHKLEIGQAIPTEQLLKQLALILKIEPIFLMSHHKPLVHEDQFHFRKLFTTRVGIKQVAMARGELIVRLVDYLDTKLKLPNLKIQDDRNVQTLEQIEYAAECCREQWGIGMGPITNMTRLAESVGAIVTSFQSVSREIDALSVSVQRPIIVRNEAKESVCRQRFDIAHELGHFVLHSGVVTGDRRTESEANCFASALLIPRAMMAQWFPKPRGARLDWIGLSDFKKTWKMSKAAILYRARQLELISDAQYRTGVITLKRDGEATREKEDHLIPPEPPELLERSLNVLADKKAIYAEDIAFDLNIRPNLLRDIVGFDVPIRKFSGEKKEVPRLKLMP